jgi:hypothetical protein
MSRFIKNWPAASLFLVLLACGVFATAGRARADHPADALFQTVGYVRDDLGAPVTNLLVYGDNFIGDVYPTRTDTNGYYMVTYPADGNYRLTVDCGELSARGYACVGDVGIAQEADLIIHDFVVPRLNATLQIATTALPRGNVGVPYNLQLEASGGQPPYEWQLAPDSPPLPAGLSFSSSGLISGTPTLFSGANLKVIVTDAASASAEKSLQIVINPKPMLSLVSWATNRFTMRLSGAPHQNYTLQVSTNLASGSWNTLYVTNHPEIGTFTVRDANATNPQGIYRILIGP